MKKLNGMLNRIYEGTEMLDEMSEITGETNDIVADTQDILNNIEKIKNTNTQNIKELTSETKQINNHSFSVDRQCGHAEFIKFSGTTKGMKAKKEELEKTECDKCIGDKKEKGNSDYEVTRKCGCKETPYLVGTAGEWLARVEHLENTDCIKCKQNEEEIDTNIFTSLVEAVKVAERNLDEDELLDDGDDESEESLQNGDLETNEYTSLIDALRISETYIDDDQGLDDGATTWDIDNLIEAVQSNYYGTNRKVTYCVGYDGSIGQMEDGDANTLQWILHPENLVTEE